MTRTGDTPQSSEMEQAWSWDLGVPQERQMQGSCLQLAVLAWAEVAVAHGVTCVSTLSWGCWLHL